MDRKNIFRWLIIAYVVICLIILGSRLVISFDSRILWLINNCFPAIFAPFPILITIALLIRDRASLLWLLVPFIGFLVIYGDRFLPQLPIETNPQDQHLRVMTFNVLNRNTNYEAISETILSSGADLVGLQELIPENARYIDHFISSEYPYHTQLPTEHKLHTGLYSRYPILDTEQLQLPWHDLSWSVVVDIDGIHINVIVIHLIPTLLREVPCLTWPERIVDRQDIRMQQVKLVSNAVTNANAPVLVLCDCNFSEFSQAYERLNNVLADSYDEVGWGLGYSITPVGRSPRVARIDYIWHTSQFTPIWARVGKDGMSDHNPVIAEFILSRSP